MCAVARTNANLDEFVMVEGQFDLGQDRRLESVRARHDDGFELVTEFAKVAFLPFGELHGLTCRVLRQPLILPCARRGWFACRRATCHPEVSIIPPSFNP